MCLQFGFVIFWRKDFGAKAAHKMLMKLTPGQKWMRLPEGNESEQSINNFIRGIIKAKKSHRSIVKAKEISFKHCLSPKNVI